MNFLSKIIFFGKRLDMEGFGSIIKMQKKEVDNAKFLRLKTAVKELESMESIPYKPFMSGLKKAKIRQRKLVIALSKELVK